MIMALAEMGHPKPQKTVVTYNILSNSIVNGMAKQEKIQSNRHEILLGQRQNKTKSFTRILGIGKEKPSG